MITNIMQNLNRLFSATSVPTKQIEMIKCFKSTYLRFILGFNMIVHTVANPFQVTFVEKNTNFCMEKKTVPCIDCDKKFTSKGLLNAHIKHVHKKEKDKICPHCAEAFFLQESYQIHVLRHNDDRQFPCEVCGKSFFTKRDLKRHIMSHTLPYHCDQCEKKFLAPNLYLKSMCK